MGHVLCGGLLIAAQVEIKLEEDKMEIVCDSTGECRLDDLGDAAMMDLLKESTTTTMRARCCIMKVTQWEKV